MTTRDSDGIITTKWAGTGDVATPESQGLTRATGWPASYSPPGTDTPQREVFNQIWREFSALAVEINQKGLLPWDATIAYSHPAVVTGSDENIYVSVQNSTNVNPVNDADDSHWTTFGGDWRLVSGSTTDLDDYTSTGFLRASSTWSNIPPHMTDYHVNIFVHSGGTNIIRQDAYPVGQLAQMDAAFFSRTTLDGGTNWSAWQRLPSVNIFIENRQPTSTDGVDGDVFFSYS